MPISVAQQKEYEIQIGQIILPLSTNQCNVYKKNVEMSSQTLIFLSQEFYRKKNFGVKEALKLLAKVCLTNKTVPKLANNKNN